MENPWDELGQKIIFYIAVIFVLLYYLSPGVMLYSYYTTNMIKWQELPIAQTFGVIFNCLYWVIVGSQSTAGNKLDTLLWNGIGLGLGVIFAILIWFAGGKIENRFFFLFMGFNVTFQIGWEISKVYKLNEPQGKEGLVSAIIASIFNVGMYIFTMQNIFTAWATHCYQKLSIVSIVTGMLSTFFWMLYGFANPDLYVVIPNAIGLVILGISLGIYVWFYNTYTESENETLNSSERKSVEIPSHETSEIDDQLLQLDN